MFNTDGLKTLYFALIQSPIKYSILILGNATKSSLERTVVLQKRVIRTMCKVQYSSDTKPLFRKLRI